MDNIRKLNQPRQTNDGFYVPTTSPPVRWLCKYTGNIVDTSKDYHRNENLYFDTKEEALRAIEEYNMPTLDLKDIYG